MTTTTEPLAEIEVTDGGAYIRVDGLTVPILPADLDDMPEVHETLNHIERVIAALQAALPKALADIASYRDENPLPCAECNGHGVIEAPEHAARRYAGREFPCGACGGEGVAA